MRSLVLSGVLALSVGLFCSMGRAAPGDAAVVEGSSATPPVAPSSSAALPSSDRAAFPTIDEAAPTKSREPADASVPQGNSVAPVHSNPGETSPSLPASSTPVVQESQPQTPPANTAPVAQVQAPPQPRRLPDVGPPGPSYTREWYGGTTLIVDGVGLVTMPIVVGFGVYLFGGPIVHMN